MLELRTILLLFALARVQSFSSVSLPIRTRNFVQKMSAQHEAGRVESVVSDSKFSRRVFVGAFLATLAAPALAEEELKVPESERVKPPAGSCAQGVGGKCDELSEGNALIKELQARSAKNRIKYQKEELESYWRRNYKDFFDYACTGYDKKCDFQENPDGTWSVGTKEGGFKLKEAKDVTLADQGLAPANK